MKKPVWILCLVFVASLVNLVPASASPISDCKSLFLPKIQTPEFSLVVFDENQRLTGDIYRAEIDAKDALKIVDSKKQIVSQLALAKIVKKYGEIENVEILKYKYVTQFVDASAPSSQQIFTIFGIPGLPSYLNIKSVFVVTTANGFHVISLDANAQANIETSFERKGFNIAGTVYRHVRLQSGNPDSGIEPRGLIVFSDKTHKIYFDPDRSVFVKAEGVSQHD